MSSLWDLQTSLDFFQGNAGHPTSPPSWRRLFRGHEEAAKYWDNIFVFLGWTIFIIDRNIMINISISAIWGISPQFSQFSTAISLQIQWDEDWSNSVSKWGWASRTTNPFCCGHGRGETRWKLQKKSRTGKLWQKIFPFFRGVETTSIENFLWNLPISWPKMLWLVMFRRVRRLWGLWESELADGGSAHEVQRQGMILGRAYVPKPWNLLVSSSFCSSFPC